jgi:NAD(P)-dependent dehydrogenase (short-subunit alcohol dehydrogenase family)
MAEQTTNGARTRMAGKTCLVTGATSGIGRVTALELARMGADVVLVGRNAGKAAAAAERIKHETGANVEVLLADLSSQAEVHRLAEAFLSTHARLDVLVNNAGAVYSAREESVDGIELTLALNHLSYFLLTNLLLKTLIASGPARVVNVSSEAHRMARINFADLQAQQRYRGFTVYGQSKLANILFTKELARRLAGTEVTANALHPGVIASGFARNNRGMLNFMFGTVLRPFLSTPEQGAQTSIYLASAPDVANVTGLYFSKQRPAKPAAAAENMTTARRLWEVSEELVGLTEPVAG